LKKKRRSCCCNLCGKAQKRLKAEEFIDNNLSFAISSSEEEDNFILKLPLKLPVKRKTSKITFCSS
jgi:hypothetical protein